MFTNCKLNSLRQLNALAVVRRLDNLIIVKDGNPITLFNLWRFYALFRLAHFGLKKINDIEVSQ